MKRRLIRQGGGGYTIYLPKKWVDRNHLGKQEDISVDFVDNDLIIRSQSKDLKKEISLNLSNDIETSVRTILTNVYRLGYDRVIVNFQTKKQFKIIYDTVKTRLLGFDIISIDNSFCIIENITEPSLEHTGNIFRKVLFNISELIDNLEKRLKGENTFDAISESEERIQLYDNFVRRVISKENRPEKSVIWNFHSDMIHAQREIFLLARYLQGKKVSVSSEIFEYLYELKKIFSLLKEGYLSNDIKKLEEIHALEKLLIYHKGHALFRRKKGEDIIILHSLTSAIRGFYLASSPLMGVFLLRQR